MVSSLKTLSSSEIYPAWISRQLSNYLTNNGTMTAAGTISKMAPEVYSGQKYDNRVDIYSLGLMLYMYLNRQKPPFLDINSTAC